MNRRETRLLVEGWRRLIENVEEDVYVYTAVTPESEDNIMSKGLLNAVTLIKDPKAVAMARPDPEEMWKWYDIDEHAGKYYAANVPHGFIMSEIGRIPPEYIEKK